MKRAMAVGSVLLLLQIILHQTKAAGDARKPVTLSEETKELRYIMYEQGTMLVELKTNMAALQKENEDLKSQMIRSDKSTSKALSELEATKKQLSDLKTKLSASKDGLDLEPVRKEIAAHTASLSSLRNSVTVNTEEVNKLKAGKSHKADLTNVKNRLAAAESAVANLKKTNAAQDNQLRAMRVDVDHLMSKNRGETKVAFSAALGLPAGLRGPFSYETTIIYRNVMTNVGNAYNPATGIFTAPVRGVYYIRFTGGVYDNKSHNTGVNLYKNGRHLLHLGENGFDGVAKHTSTGVTMDLMPGDQVYTRLPTNYVLWDDAFFRTSFSGFFLFPM